MVTEEQKIQSRNSDERIRTEINTYNKYQIEVTNTSNESKIKHVNDRDCLTGHTLRYTDTDHSEVGVENNGEIPMSASAPKSFQEELQKYFEMICAYPLDST